MDDRLIRNVERSFEAKDTDELLAIWHEENREEYSDEAFEAIRRILGVRRHAFSPKRATSEIAKDVRSYPSGPRDKEYVCTKCHVAFTQERPFSRSVLGFRRFDCPACGENNHYPLTRGYKAIYWFLVVAAPVLGVIAFRQGYVFIPGLFWIGALVALGNDGYFKRKVKRGWYEHECRGNPRATVAAMTEAERIASRDPIRWFHVVFAIVVPYVGLPWGIVNLLRRKRRSGLLLVVVSIIVSVVALGIGLIGAQCQ
jgi:hypothetical protein